jgi:hypothetical protein
MVDPINDIARQARQGSVSAIIQVLNDKLVTSGVRTRAIFSQGVLQLLCEAAKQDQLEQSILVPQVKQILESIQPRGIRRVNINSRIVREQQLLWFEEINRDPDHQLLWSEEITLSKPNFLQRLTRDLKDNKPDSFKVALPKASPVRLAREKKQFWRGLLGGASLSVLLLLLGWVLYNWLEPKLTAQPQATRGDTQTAKEAKAAATASANSPAATAGKSDNPSSPSETSASQDDPFVLAVRLAEESVVTGRNAQTPAEWLELASRWQRASDLMSQVPPDDQRYATARSRVALYRQNSEAALAEAKKSRP